MGTMFLAAASKSSGSSSFFFIILIVGVLAVMYFLTIRPQRARQRQAAQTQRELTPGARVRTTAGIYGTVTSVIGNDVTLEIAPGVEIRLLRRAIMDVISDGGGGFNPGPAARNPRDEQADDSYEADDSYVADDGYAAEPADDAETTPAGGASEDGAGGTAKRTRKRAGGAGAAS